MTVYTKGPYTREEKLIPAVVCNLKDEARQQRVCIQTGPLADITDISKLPWAKTLANHSVSSSNNGGTVEATHSFKNGDIVMVAPDHAEGSHNYTVYGMGGTIKDAASGQMGGSGTSGSADQFAWNADLRTGSKAAKSPRIQAMYPQNPTYKNPGQTQYMLSDAKHIREFASKQIGKFTNT